MRGDFQKKGRFDYKEIKEFELMVEMLINKIILKNWKKECSYMSVYQNRYRTIGCTSYTFDDLKQQMMSELIIALSQFDETKKIKKSTFVYTHLHNRAVNLAIFLTGPKSGYGKIVDSYNDIKNDDPEKDEDYRNMIIENELDELEELEEDMENEDVTDEDYDLIEDDYLARPGENEAEEVQVSIDRTYTRKISKISNYLKLDSVEKVIYKSLNKLIKFRKMDMFEVKTFIKMIYNKMGFNNELSQEERDVVIDLYKNKKIASIVVKLANKISIKIKKERDESKKRREKEQKNACSTTCSE